MFIIEPHIHMYSRTTDDYIAMYREGIRVCVEPSFWLGSNRRFPGTFFDYFQLILDFETVRAKRFGLDHFVAIALNPKEAENTQVANEVIRGMEQYLSHPRCVAIGEIGLNLITENEIKAFRTQLLMAEVRKMPVIIHLPHIPKEQGARIIVDIIKAEGVSQNRILIDHNTEVSIAIARETSCYCGLTVYPFSKLDPQRALEIVRQEGSEKMIISGSADWGVSDPLSLVKVINHFRQMGEPENVIQKLIRDNAGDLYGHSPHWKPDFDLTPVPVSDYQR
jgi:predicted metal-dependent TIM-barrel fold hydrolase